MIFDSLDSLTQNFFNEEFIRENHLKRLKINLNDTIELGFKTILTQVFDHGFFHADPHPGNLIVKRDGTLGIVDFGIVGHFDDKLKQQSIRLLSGVVDKDADEIVDVLCEMGLQAGNDVDELRAEIKDLIEPLQYSTLQEVKLSRIIEDIMDISLKYKVRIPLQFFLFGKTLVTLEGLALEFNPDFNVVQETRPFLQKLLLKQYSPKIQIAHFAKDVRKYKRFFEELPERSSNVLHALESGKFNIHLEDASILRLSSEIDRSSNRIAYGLIIASLFVASSFLIQIKDTPLILGIPLLAFMTFTMAILLGVVLVTSIVQEH